MRQYAFFIIFLTIYGKCLAQVKPFFDLVTDQAIHDVEQRGDTCYIAGDFESISKRTGAGVLLDPETLEIVADFPEVNGSIHCATPDGKGGLYIGGRFSMVGGKPRQNFAHIDKNLNVTGISIRARMHTSPTSSYGGEVNSITLSEDKIYIGGQFTQINGQERRLVVELDRATGQLTPNKFGFSVETIAGNRIPTVHTLQVHNNQLFIGGRFEIVQEKDRECVASIDLDTYELLDWKPKFGDSSGAIHIASLVINDSSVFLNGSLYRGREVGYSSIVNVDIVTGDITNFGYVGHASNWPNGEIVVYGSLLFDQKDIIDMTTSQVIDTLKYPPTYAPFSEREIMAIIRDTLYLSAGGTLMSLDPNSFELISRTAFNNNILAISHLDNHLFVGGRFDGYEINKISSIAAVTRSDQKFLPLPYFSGESSFRDQKIHEIILDGEAAYVAGRFDRVRDETIGVTTQQRDIAKINLHTGTRIDWHAKIGGGYFGGGTYHPPRIKHVHLLNDQLLVAGNYLGILSDPDNIYSDTDSWGVNTFDLYTGDALFNATNWPFHGEYVSDIAVFGDTIIFADRDFERRTGAGSEPNRYKGLYFLNLSDYSLMDLEVPLNKAISSIKSLSLVGNDLYFPTGTTYYASPSELYKLNLLTMQLEKLPIRFDGPVDEMVYMGNHTLYVAGSFNNVNGYPRKQLAAIDLRTYEVKPWNPNLPPQPLSIQRLKAWDDQLAIMGSFEYLGSTYAPNLALLDTAAGTYAQLTGRAYWDLNQNHQFDTGDQPMAGYVVDVQPGNYYATTDSLGFYRLAVDSGAYTLNLIVPEKKGFEMQRRHPRAEAGYTFSTDTLTEHSTQLDFAYFSEPRPYLSVDLDAGRRRRCFTSTTTVSYQNQGLLPTSSARVQIEYPEHVVPLRSTPAWDERNGNVLTYYVGDLFPNKGGRIVIRDSVVCGDESIRGLTQCTEARIFPTNERPVDSRWDRSETTLDAYCQDNGFVRLRLRNTGDGDMADSAAFRIYLDGELAHHRNYRLLAGDSLILNVPSLGKTLRTEADLTAFHPDKKTNTITVEGCSSSDTATVSTGFVNSHVQNDEEDTFELSCAPIVDSYDPNDKRAVPSGIRAEHFTREQSELEYTIRFQNTGTDTAYTIVVVDTLSEHLDLSTLRMGVTSHPVAWTLSGRGKPVLTWRFEQINLPDSNRNEPTSHGFIKFKIAMKEELPRGTVVNNQAAIYFDYNSPIITNTVFNTVGLPEDSIARVEVQDCSQRPLRTEHRQDTLYLCGEHQLLLEAEDLGGGFGQWQLAEGQGTFEDRYAKQTLLSNIGPGVNRVVWQVVYCDQSASHELVIIRNDNRPEPPQVDMDFYSYCEGETIDTLFADGNKIRWYRDSMLSQLLATGNHYVPEQGSADTLYVTQTEGYCQSKAWQVILAPTAPPPPPVVVAYEHCDNVATIELSAEGEHITWYADSLGQRVLGTGNTLTLTHEEVQTHFHVSQTVGDCESEFSTVPVEIVNFSTHDIFVPNVITPNGDQKNDYFFLPPSPVRHCLGNFREVRIQNRWGKTIYHSRDENFRWAPSRKVPAGVYFYVIAFSNVRLNGSVSILR